jgi:hypothetical protein
MLLHDNARTNCRKILFFDIAIKSSTILLFAVNLLLKTTKYFDLMQFSASVQSPSYAETPQVTATNLPLSMDPVLCEYILT